MLSSLARLLFCTRAYAITQGRVFSEPNCRFSGLRLKKDRTLYRDPVMHAWEVKVDEYNTNSGFCGKE